MRQRQRHRQNGVSGGSFDLEDGGHIGYLDDDEEDKASCYDRFRLLVVFIYTSYFFIFILKSVTPIVFSSFFYTCARETNVQVSFSFFFFLFG